MRQWRGPLKTIIIIPAFNEEGSLERTVESLRTVAPERDFLIVNDGSTDGTVQVCRKNAYPFLDLTVNLGLGGGFKAGMKYAWKHHYDCAIQFDADGQHLPEYIPQLEAALTDADIVIGSRFLQGKKDASMRSVGGSLLGGAIKLTTGTALTDPTSGMRAFNARMIEQLAKNPDMNPEPDTISYLIKRAGAKVVEVPVEMGKRTTGISYLNTWRASFYMLRMTVSIFLMQFFRKRIGGER